MKQFKLLGVAMLVSGMLSAGMAQAADVDAVIQQRKGVMGIIGANMGFMGCTLKGACDAGPKVTLKQAQSLAFAASISLATFAENVKGASVKTTASPKIWDDWASYKKGMQIMEERALDLVDAVKSGDKGSMGAAMKGLGETCKGCHDNYREK
ncbi:cytochrome c, class II [Magnetococcus marinus MC-1]|uniref:Cytochrome c, class II n=1 Tax=Magnetococcus marinus (strain ATCC BAA-1437 / JCM 17883 / MC-1) TaxID=156889 RepID=A0L6N1_MAGMM|nr:cytochrome c [Magnetococcus marinus]ABK43624.1 cytochrome c, class II [Magnetococcus marinus MC-1]